MSIYSMLTKDRADGTPGVLSGAPVYGDRTFSGWAANSAAQEVENLAARAVVGPVAQSVHRRMFQGAARSGAAAGSGSAARAAGGIRLGRPGTWKGLKTLFSGEGAVAKAAKWTYGLGRGALKTGFNAAEAFNRPFGIYKVDAAGKLLPGEVGKFKLSSRVGAAAAFAYQGVSDGIRSIANSNITENANGFFDDRAASFAWGRFGKTFGKRFGIGLLRALDTVALNIPSIAANAFGAGDLQGDWFFDSTGDADSARHAKLMEDLDRARDNPAGAARIAQNYDAEVLANLRNGVDEDGNRLQTVSADGTARDMTDDEVRRAYGAVVTARARTKAARERMFYSGPDLSSLAAKDVRAKLAQMMDEYNSRVDDLTRKRDNFSAVLAADPKLRRMLTSGSSRRDATDEELAAKWFEVAAGNLSDEFNTRHERLAGTTGYADLIRANRDRAYAIYSGRVAGRMDPDAITAEFNRFWDASNSLYKEQFSPEEFNASITSAIREADQAQPGVIESSEGE